MNDEQTTFSMNHDPIRDEFDQRLSGLLADSERPVRAVADIRDSVRRRIVRRRRLNRLGGGGLVAAVVAIAWGTWGQSTGSRTLPNDSLTSPVGVERLLATERHQTPPVVHHEFISVELAAIIEALEPPDGR